MNKLVAALKPEAESGAAGDSAGIVPMNFIENRIGGPALSTVAGNLTGFRADPKTGERRLLDNVLVGVLALLAHAYVVHRFQDKASDEAVGALIKLH